jgi:hypothetical protein
MWRRTSNGLKRWPGSALRAGLARRSLPHMWPSPRIGQTPAPAISGPLPYPNYAHIPRKSAQSSAKTAVSFADSHIRPPDYQNGTNVIRIISGPFTPSFNQAAIPRKSAQSPAKTAVSNVDSHKSPPDYQIGTNVIRVIRVIRGPFTPSHNQAAIPRKSAQPPTTKHNPR